jgi:hypothetical protein
MKMGVSILPWGVSRTPRRADVCRSFDKRVKLNDFIWIVFPVNSDIDKNPSLLLFFRTCAKSCLYYQIGPGNAMM